MRPCLILFAIVALATGCSDNGSSPADARPDASRADGPPRDAGPDRSVNFDTSSTADGPADLGPDFAAPPNERCADAEEIVLTDGAGSVSGDTRGAHDEFSTLACGTTIAVDQLPGPQVYYKFSATADQWYKLVLDPDFRANLYLFTDSACSEAAIQTDCDSGGASGLDGRDTEPPFRQAFYFKAPADGDVFVGVDSGDPVWAGAFTLDVAQFTPPTQGACADPVPLSFDSNNKASARGDLGPGITPSEFANLECNIHTLRGPQVFYSFDAEAGTSYTITLTAEAGQFLYVFVFSDTCDRATIGVDCEPVDDRGLPVRILAAPVYSGESDSISFTPTTSATYKLGISSAFDYNYGDFLLEVSF